MRASYEIINPMSSLEGLQMIRNIERYARISHDAEIKQTEDSWERFIKAVVIDHGDWSVVEHEKATVIFNMNRGLTHELVRHRIGSYTQSSTRFINYTTPAHRPEFILSDSVKPQDVQEWSDDLTYCNGLYQKWMKRGYAPQVARGILPHDLAARIAMTCNLRNWRYVLMARTTKETHPDLRRLMIELLKDFQDRIPLLFNDIVPEEKQSIQIARAR